MFWVLKYPVVELLERSCCLRSGSGLGPWSAGALFDLTGSYRVPFLIATHFRVAGSASFWLAERPATRVRG